jgi:hypothetical protein
MNSAYTPSASNTGGTPPTARPPQGKSISDDLTEAQYLHLQAANAKAAIKETLTDFGRSMGGVVDPRALTGEHPWLALAGAAVAGFAAGAVLMPSKEQRALKRLAEFERALGLRPPKRDTGTDSQSSDDTTATGKPVKKGLLASLAGDLIRSVGPALASALTAGMATEATEQAQSNVGGNGTDPTTSAPK